MIFSIVKEHQHFLHTNSQIMRTMIDRLRLYKWPKLLQLHIWITLQGLSSLIISIIMHAQFNDPFVKRCRFIREIFGRK